MDRALDPGILANLMNAFSFVLTGGFGRLMPNALSLLAKLAILELILVATWAWWYEDNLAAALLVKLCWITGFVFLVTQWPRLTRIVMDSFVMAGLRGGGGPLTVEDFSNPAGIARFGLEVTAVLFAQVARGTGFTAVFSLPMTFIDGLISLGIVLAFFVMAIQVFITFLEFYLVSMLALVLVPFGLFRHTAFLGERGIGIIFSFGIKLMVLAAIMNAAQPILQTIRLSSANPTLNETLSLLLAAWAVALFAWHAPSVASGLLAGAPTLTAGTVAHTALATGAGVGLAGMAGVGTGRLLGAATRTGLRFGGAGVAALQAGGVRGLLQTASATVGYRAEQLTASYRGAYAGGRIAGANFAPVIGASVGRDRAMAPRLFAQSLATRVVPPPAPPSGGVQPNLRQP